MHTGPSTRGPPEKFYEAGCALFLFSKIGDNLCVFFLNLRDMASDFVQSMKTRLEEEKARLEKELSGFAHRNPKAATTDYDADFPNLGDKEDENASEVAQYSDNLSLEDELEKALRDVESALSNMEAGTYGTCKYCSQAIDERRLVARPTSSSCIQCKKTLTQEV